MMRGDVVTITHSVTAALASAVFAVSLSPSRAADGNQGDHARAAVFGQILAGMQDRACLAVRPDTVQAASALRATDTTAVLADLSGPTEDPSHEVMSALARLDVVSMSKCPEQRDPRHVYHVVEGPLRFLPSGSAQMAVSVNLDGFPSIYLCEAARQNGAWKVEKCALVMQA
jgi:hypothetical protein